MVGKQQKNGTARQRPYFNIVGALVLLLGSEAVASTLPGSSTGKQTGADCLISAEAAIRHVGRGARIVDVRSPDAFRIYRIPGALNIPVYAVKTKAYLKREMLILADSGPQLRDLIPACERLKSAGFAQVKVLHGGIQGWRQAGGSVEGMVPPGGIGWLEPRDLLLEYDPLRWKIIHVVSRPESTNEPMTVGENLPLAEAEDYLSTLKPGPVPPEPGGKVRFVAVIADEAEMYGRLEKSIGEQRANIYFVAGGAARYRQQEERMRAVRSKRVFLLQQPASCSR